jgi:hypothetical protein
MPADMTKVQAPESARQESEEREQATSAGDWTSAVIGNYLHALEKSLGFYSVLGPDVRVSVATRTTRVAHDLARRCGPRAPSRDGALTRRPGPRRAPRGGSLLGLHLPAPLGVEPRRGALCGAGLVLRMRSTTTCSAARGLPSGTASVPSGREQAHAYVQDNWPRPYRWALVAAAARGEGGISRSQPPYATLHTLPAPTANCACIGTCATRGMANEFAAPWTGASPGRRSSRERPRRLSGLSLAGVQGQSPRALTVCTRDCMSHRRGARAPSHRYAPDGHRVLRSLMEICSRTCWFLSQHRMVPMCPRILA